MKFELLKNTEIAKIYGSYSYSKLLIHPKITVYVKNANYSWQFNIWRFDIYEQENFMLSRVEHEKKVLYPKMFPSSKMRA